LKGHKENLHTGVQPQQLIQHLQFTAARNKFKIKETVHKFQNVRQDRTGRNTVKSGSPNAASDQPRV
jgi:hypothetical protein